MANGLDLVPIGQLGFVGGVKPDAQPTQAEPPSVVDLPPLDASRYGPDDDDEAELAESERLADEMEFDEQAVLEALREITAPPAPAPECAVPGDRGFHVKQVNFLRPFKLIGEVLGDAEIRVTGDAEFRADAEREGTWRIERPWLRTGHDQTTAPVTEAGELETTQQVIVDKVMIGPRQEIPGDIGKPYLKTSPVWKWDASEFQPTGPMRGKCGTLKCHVRETGEKEYTPTPYCETVKIEGAQLDVKPLRPVAHDDFKQYRLHVDPSIPRLCESSLPEGLREALESHGVPVRSLFESDTAFRVLKEDAVTACETHTIARQNFELKYREVFRHGWQQPATKACAKEWSQEGLEVGRGTYEQLAGARVQGYFVQPGAEVGQINTYVRQVDRSREKGEERETDSEIDDERPDGEASYAVESRGPWSRVPGTLAPRKVTIHEEEISKEDKEFRPVGVVETDPLYDPVFNKCPLLRVAPNNPCPLDGRQREPLLHPERSGRVVCLDKVPEVLVPAKCLFDAGLGQPVPAAPEGVLYAEPEQDEAGREETELEALAGRLERELREVLERGARLEEIAASEARLRAALEAAEARAPDEAALAEAEELRAALEPLGRERDDIASRMGEHSDDVRQAAKALEARAAELGAAVDVGAIVGRVQAEAAAERAAREAAEAADREAVAAGEVREGGRALDDCPLDDPVPVDIPAVPDLTEPPLSPPPLLTLPPLDLLTPGPEGPPLSLPPLLTMQPRDVEPGPEEPPLGPEEPPLLTSGPPPLLTSGPPPLLTSGPPPLFSPGPDLSGTGGPPATGPPSCAPKVPEAAAQPEIFLFNGDEIALPVGSGDFLRRGGLIEYGEHNFVAGLEPGTVVEPPEAPEGFALRGAVLPPEASGPGPSLKCLTCAAAHEPPAVQPELFTLNGATVALPVGSGAFLASGGLIEYGGRRFVAGPQPGTLAEAGDGQLDAAPQQPADAGPEGGYVEAVEYEGGDELVLIADGPAFGECAPGAGENWISVGA